MVALYISTTPGSNDHIVPRPRATDAIGAALRDAYGAALGLPQDMARLIQRIDRTR